MLSDNYFLISMIGTFIVFVVLMCIIVGSFYAAWNAAFNKWVKPIQRKGSFLVGSLAFLAFVSVLSIWGFETLETPSEEYFGLQLMLALIALGCAVGVVRTIVEFFRNRSYHQNM